MRKEIEISGCVEVPEELTIEEFEDSFIEFIESKSWYFGGGFNEIIDGYLVNNKGEKIRHILDDIE